MNFDKYAVPVGADYLFLIEEGKKRPHLVNFTDHKRDKCHDGGAWYAAAWGNMMTGLNAGYIKTIYIFSKEAMATRIEKCVSGTIEEVELLLDAKCDVVVTKGYFKPFKINFRKRGEKRNWLVGTQLRFFPSDDDAKEWANENLPHGASFAEVFAV